MAVPINAPIIGSEETKAVNDVLRNGSLTSSAMSGGRCVQEFERQALSFLGSKFAVAVNSGTAALQAALLALNVQAGDEVLLPSFTFVATANAVASIGAKPVFVDILRDNYTIDPSDLRRKITKKSRAVIPVHLYGGVAFMDEILKIASDNSLKIIEDAAQSLGVSHWRQACWNIWRYQLLQPVSCQSDNFGRGRTRCHKQQAAARQAANDTKSWDGTRI